jgi:hypothetical protein
MSALLKLSTLAVRGLVFGACQAVGVEAGEKAVEPVSRFLGDRFRQQGQRLMRALEKANDRAWNALEFALAGSSLWQRCTSLFGRPDEKAFREQLRLFLDSLPVSLFDAQGPEFRRQALAELRLARRDGALRVSGLDVRQVAAQAGRFAAFTSPEALLAAEKQALVEIADSFPGERYAHLREMLQLTAPEGTPLLTAAVRFFLRREIEIDRELFQGLAFALLEQQGGSLDAGLHQLATLLDQHSGRLEQLVSDVLQLAVATHDEVVRIADRLDQLLGRYHLTGRELRPDDTFLAISEEERRLIREVVRSYRALPDAQKSSRVELAFKVGQAEALAGDYAEAKRDFAAVALLTSEPAAQAEAQASACQAALADGDFAQALTSLVETARLDPARFAPFPLDKYQPERILGAGGFGIAVLCRHTFQRTTVVVKSLWINALDRGIGDVFHEAQVLAGVHHPAIVSILDCDYADRDRHLRPYIVMEYFDGMSLAAQVKEHGPLAHGDFAILARQIAEGLQAAHEQSVFHRDVKPANVLVRFSSSQARLIDFGLAMRPTTLAVTHILSAQARKTILGESMAGTWKYAAPEQLGELPGVAVGAYSDIHAFGRTCYFALLGTPEPDDAEKEQLPEGWRRLLSRCTARLPARRPQSFTEVVQELDRLVETSKKHDVSPPLVDAPGTTALVTRRSARITPRRPAHPEHVRTSCVRTIAAHDGTVSALAFRSDGKLLATGGFDDRVRLWSLPSGGMLLSLNAHGADVNCLAFRPDGNVLATASDDREVRLWSIPAGKLVGVLRHPERVYAVAYSPDGQLLATACDDFKVRLWVPAAHGEPARLLTGHTSVVRHLAFSPDGQWLASASGDRLVNLWNVVDGKRRQPLVGHSHAVWGVAFSPDGQLVATASQDKTVRIWNVADSQSLVTLEGHEDIVWCVAFSNDGRLVATASHDRSARLWSAHDGRHLVSLTGHTGLVRHLAFAPDGTMLATASGDGSVRMWLFHEDSERCDWSAGMPGLPPRPRVALHRAGNGVVYCGDELWLEIGVENVGRGDLVQLRATLESEAAVLQGLQAFFGRIRPGETVHRCVSVVLPADLPTGMICGELVFHEGNEYQPASMPVVFHVRPLPREDFPIRWRLVDDGTGNSFGDGDGRPQRGECVDVVTLVENQTGESLDGLLLTLTAIEVPAGVVVNVPREALPTLEHGDRVEGRVTFSIKPAANTGPARFELRVETADGRLFARVPVETRID